MDNTAVSRTVKKKRSSNVHGVDTTDGGGPATNNSSSSTTTGTRPQTPGRGRGPTINHNKKADNNNNNNSKYNIEMAPLLFGVGSSGDDSLSPGGGLSASASPQQAQQFADTWLGSYVKLRAKQAEKHAYNLRASIKSKKGFHVQIPKRMLFYTVLVFLMLPICIFFYKEIHIHDHDPAFHMEKLGNHNSTGSTRRHDYGPKKRKRKNSTNTVNNKGSVRSRQQHPNNKRNQQHPSLTQLLAGGLPRSINATSNSRSRDHSGDVVQVSTAALPLEVAESEGTVPQQTEQDASVTSSISTETLTDDSNTTTTSTLVGVVAGAETRTEEEMQLELDDSQTKMEQGESTTDTAASLSSMLSGANIPDAATEDAAMEEIINNSTTLLPANSTVRRQRQRTRQRLR